MRKKSIFPVLVVVLCFSMLLISRPVLAEETKKEGALKVTYPTSMMRGFENLVIEVENIGFPKDTAYSNYSSIITQLTITLYTTDLESERLTFWRPNIEKDYIRAGEVKSLNYSTMTNYKEGLYTIKIIADFLQPSESHNDSNTFIPRAYFDFDFELMREANIADIAQILLFHSFLLLIPLVAWKMKKLNEEDINTYGLKDTVIELIKMALIFPVAFRYTRRNRLKTVFFFMLGVFATSLIFSKVFRNLVFDGVKSWL